MVPTTGGAARPVTRGAWWLYGHGWSSDGHSLIAISVRNSGRTEMWQFPLDRASQPHRVTSFEAGRAKYVSISRKSGALLWVRDLTSGSLWRMPANQPGGPAELLVNSFGSEMNGQWSKEGRLLFQSDRSGWTEIWIARADGSEPRQATRFQGPFVGDPAWSPDGRHIAFTAHLKGNADIFTMDCEADGPQPCGNLKQLTESPAADANPTWSADGKWIYFSSNRNESHFEIWKIPSAGGEPVRVTSNHGYVAHESPDGKWLYYSKLEQSCGFWRIPLPSRGMNQLEQALAPQTPCRAAATWAVGQHELYYYPSEEASSVPFPPVRAIDLATGRKRDLSTGNKRLGRGLRCPLTANGSCAPNTTVHSLRS